GLPHKIIDNLPPAARTFLRNGPCSAKADCGAPARQFVRFPAPESCLPSSQLKSGEKSAAPSCPWLILRSAGKLRVRTSRPVRRLARPESVAERLEDRRGPVPSSATRRPTNPRPLRIGGQGSVRNPSEACESLLRQGSCVLRNALERY